MAHLLYRIGRLSASRPLVVIGAWILALILAGGSYATFHGTLSDSFSIPGLETEKVTDTLAEQMPELTGGSARIVFSTEDGSAFTDEQKAGIAAALAQVTELDTVKSATDPFALSAQLAEQATQLEAGAASLEEGKATLEQSRTELEQGQQALDAAIEEAKAAGMYEAAKAQFDAQQAQLDEGTAKLEEGAAQLETQGQQLDLGSRLAALAQGIRVVSQDESTALAAITFFDQAYALTPEQKSAVMDTVLDNPVDGVVANFSSELTTDVSGVIGAGEIAGVALAIIVLFVLMRTAMPALQPIIVSVLGVGVSVALSLSFSGVVDMQSISPILGIMLGLAVGIDYSLFILYRHRTQVRRGMAIAESAGLANGTSGNAVVFAGSTVVIALAALAVTRVPFLAVMGAAGAAGVAVAVIAAVTLTPALLGLIGKRVLPKRERSAAPKPHTETITPIKTRTAILGALGAIAVLATLAIPALSMRLGLPDGTQEPTDSTQYKAYHQVADAFGPGFNGTMLITAMLPAPVAETDVLATQVSLAETIAQAEGIAAIAPAGVDADREFFAFQVIPEAGPNSQENVDLVAELRDLNPLDDGTAIGVAGEASANVDVVNKLSDVLPQYLVVVVGLSFVILVIVFRSLLVPFMATAGFVLSLFAAFGAVTAVYQWGWLGSAFGVHDPAPLLSFLPILLTGILFGLAMDYQLFITTGMREAYVHGMTAREAVVAGVRHGRAVVTAAAIIMLSVFGGFVFSHLAMARPIGFGLAVGVAVDAFVVRMVLIPSLMHLAGDKAWWLPRWLDRIVPNVDVEGSQLEREHPTPSQA